ncbi:MAG: cytochrome b/b6 domain-containing protein [Rheinheimera sp.]|nr:cytochrome b/b6 domain-containing protein [Rheinheimera sp.]
MSQKVRVWDLAVRFFHWSQALLVLGLWYTGEEGLMAQHQLMAYVLLALLIARIVWGFIGSHNARFASFAAKPLAALRYLRKPYSVTGHNPASFYMIMLLLLLLLVQLLSGLATFDNSYTSDGPLVSLLSANLVDIASDIHSSNINLLLAFIALHIVAAIWHSLRVHNVLAVMLTGKARLPDAKAPTLRSSWPFFLLLALLLGLLYWWQGAALLALL